MFNYIVRSYGSRDIIATAIDEFSMHEFSATDKRYGRSLPDIDAYFEAVNRGSCDLSIHTGKFIFYYNNQTWCWLMAENCYDAVAKFRKIACGKRENFKHLYIRKFGSVEVFDKDKGKWSPLYTYRDPCLWRNRDRC